MLALPTPQRMPEPLVASEVAAHQRLDCARRPACLDVAARRNWPGLSCGGCPAYVSVPLTITDVRVDSPLGELSELCARARAPKNRGAADPPRDERTLRSERRIPKLLPSLDPGSRVRNDCGLSPELSHPEKEQQMSRKTKTATAKSKPARATTTKGAARPLSNKASAAAPAQPRLKEYPASKKQRQPQPGSRRETVLALMGRKTGATAGEMMKAAKWNHGQWAEAMRILSRTLGFGLREAADGVWRLIDTEGQVVTWKPEAPSAKEVA